MTAMIEHLLVGVIVIAGIWASVYQNWGIVGIAGFLLVGGMAHDLLVIKGNYIHESPTEAKEQSCEETPAPKPQEGKGA